MGVGWRWGRAGVTRTSLCPAVSRLAHSSRRPRVLEPLLGLLPGPLQHPPKWSPSLRLSKPSACCHHRSAHLFPPPRSPSGSIAGRGESSPSGGTEFKAILLGPCQPCSRVLHGPLPRSDPGEALDSLSLSPCIPSSASLLVPPSAGGALHGVLLPPLPPRPQLGLSSRGAPGVCPQRGASCGLAGIPSCRV